MYYSGLSPHRSRTPSSRKNGAKMTRWTILRLKIHPPHSQKSMVQREKNHRQEDPREGTRGKLPSSETTSEKRSFRNILPRTEGSVTSVFRGELIESELGVSFQL